VAWLFTATSLVRNLPVKEEGIWEVRDACPGKPMRLLTVMTGVWTDSTSERAVISLKTSTTAACLCCICSMSVQRLSNDTAVWQGMVLQVSTLLKITANILWRIWVAMGPEYLVTRKLIF